MFQRIAMKSAILALTFTLSFAAYAAADELKTVSVPPGELGKALRALADQVGVEFVYQSDQVRGLQTGGVSGDYSPRNAVLKLLEGTSLQLRTDENSGALLITLPAAKPDLGTSALQDEPVAFETKPVNDNSTAGNTPIDKAAATSYGQESVRTAEQTNETANELEQVVVTGTHIRGDRDLPSPVITFTRDDIARAGYVTTEALFESLPQNFAEVTPDGIYGSGSSTLSANNYYERASAINLRGLGAESTLTLVNGKRRAGSVFGRVVDVSAIPLSAIERIEVVTGGRSAIYGSDAVAGVVNILTRRQFDGVETQASVGGASEGGERLQLSLTGGTQSARGGIVGAYDYQEEETFDLIDTEFVVSPIESTGDIPLSVDIQPETRRHSLFFAGHYHATDRVELYIDGLFNTRDSLSEDRLLRLGAPLPSFLQSDVSFDQFSLAAGTRIEVGSVWTVDLSGAANQTDGEIGILEYYDDGFFSGLFPLGREDHAKLNTISAVIDGPLAFFGSVTPRMAFGAETRKEQFDVTSSDQAVEGDDSRTVRSAFLELLVPLVEDDPQTTRTERLELSVAGRYDDYSDFGSSFNPQIGVIWQPLQSLAVRGAYATAFRAPGLHDVADRPTVVIAERADPAAPDGTTTVMEVLSGTVEDLGPEEAKTWSFGFDYTPIQLSNTRMSLSYFEVEYEDRLEVPATGADVSLALTNEQNFPGLIDRDPSSSTSQHFIDTSDGFFNITDVPFDPENQSVADVFPDLVIFDNRLNNIAIETVCGLDFTFDASSELQLGVFNVGINATYTLDHERSVTTTSPSFSVLNAVGKPVDLRVRTEFGWTKRSYGAFVYLTYSDGYSNPFVTPEGRIDSWTTVDLTLRWDGSDAVVGSWTDGVSIALTIDNLLDSDPPAFLDGDDGVGYDPTNANPFGRYLSLRLSKSW